MLSSNHSNPIKNLILNILFIHQDAEIQQEIDEYLNLSKRNRFFAKNTEEAIIILSNREISLVVLQIRTLREAAILRYLNEQHPGLKVLIMAGREYDDIISVFGKGKYRLIRQPDHLSQLKESIESYLQPSP
jgi:DNA-binding NtrC family response regulator